jgi:hypothetical protein
LFEILVSRGKGFSSEAADFFSESETFTSEAAVFSWEAVGTQTGLVADTGNFLRSHP